MIYVVECACGCEEIFETTRHRQKYIKGHYDKLRRDVYKKQHVEPVQIECVYCEEAFTPKYKRQRFCKPEHAIQFKKEQEATSLFIRVPKSLLIEGDGKVIVTFRDSKVTDIYKENGYE